MSWKEFESNGPNDLYVISEVKKRFNKCPYGYRQISNGIIDNFIKQECNNQINNFGGFGDWKKYKKFGVAREVTQRVYNCCYSHMQKSET